MGSFQKSLSLLISVFSLSVCQISGAKKVNSSGSLNTSDLHVDSGSDPSLLDYEMYVYETKKYERIVSHFPIYLSRRSLIYVELRYTGSSNRKILLPKTCHVSASKDTAYKPKHSLIYDYCAVDDTSRYESSILSATRFSFEIRQYFGLNEQFLFVHCSVTICERKERPDFHIFNCNTQAQYCPQQQQTVLLAGPFVVLPVGNKEDGSSLTSTFGPLPTPQDNTKESEDSFSFTNAMIMAAGTFLLGALSLGLILMIFQCRKDRRLAIMAT